MTSAQDQVESSDLQLKHLGFIRTLTIHAVVLLLNLYDWAKRSSGSLQSPIGKVENVIMAVVGPIYDRLKGVPDDLLLFLDNKVDEGVHKFEEHVPQAVKMMVYKAHLLCKKAFEVAQNLAKLVELVQNLGRLAKVSGPLAAIGQAGEMSKNIAIGQLTAVWDKVNKHPSLHGVAKMAIPTAKHLSDKYNNLVKDTAKKGLSFFDQIPLVPMAEVHKQEEAVKKGDVADEVAKMGVPTAKHLSDKYNNLVKDTAKKGLSFFDHIPLVPMAERHKQEEAVKKGDVAGASNTDRGLEKE